MNVAAEVTRLEKRIKGAGHPVAELLRRANVDAAQWQRWKAGKQEPMLKTWGRIAAAAEEMVPAEQARAS